MLLAWVIGFRRSMIVMSVAKAKFLTAASSRDLSPNAILTNDGK